MENSSKLLALLESEYSEAKAKDFQDLQATLMAGLNWGNKLLD